MSISLAGMFGGAGGGAKGREKRSMTVVEARPYLEEAEAERQFPAELLAKEAVRVGGTGWHPGLCVYEWATSGESVNV